MSSRPISPVPSAAEQQQKQQQEGTLHSGSLSDKKLPQQLQVGATRYILIDLGGGGGNNSESDSSGGAGAVYVPSLALQKRPLPMVHTWRPRLDRETGGYFFVNLHDRAKVWQLPDVQHELATNLAAHQYEATAEERERLEQQVNDQRRASRELDPLATLEAEELATRVKLQERHRKEWLQQTDDFRDDISTMQKLARVQLAMIEKQLRDDLDKACRVTTNALLEKAETKMASRRAIADLFQRETTCRSDLRYAYDHELMQLREDEVRERLSAKVKTRAGAADRFHHFERVAVEGAEELQRDVMVQEEAVARARAFMDFCKLRLGGYVRLMKPVPGDPHWSPWAEEIKPEDAFISSKEFGLFWTPPPGQVVHTAWYAKTHKRPETEAELLGAARIDACVLFGDFVLGLSELYRLFIRSAVVNPSVKIRWLDAQQAIDGSALGQLFPSSLERSKERELIDVLKSEQDWRDRALATALGVQKKREASREQDEKMRPLVERRREMEHSQVIAHDTALGRFTRRFESPPSSSSASAATPRQPGTPNASRILPRQQDQQQHLNNSTSVTNNPRLTPQMNVTADEYDLLQKMRQQDSRKRMTDFDRSLADVSADRLELIRAIKLGEVLSDKSAPAASAFANSAPRRTADLSGGNSNNNSAGSPFLDERRGKDWSQMDDSNGGLRWERRSCRGVTVLEDGTAAVFDPEHAEQNWRPFRICPAVAVGSVGVSRGLFIWQVRVRVSGYRKFAGSPTFKVGMVSRFFVPAMEHASARNQLLAGLAASRTGTEKAMSYWYDENGSLFCGTTGYELEEVSHKFGPPLRPNDSDYNNSKNSNNSNVVPACNVTIVLDLDRLFLQFFVNQKTAGVAFKFDAVKEAEPLFPCIAFAAVGDEAVLMPPDSGVVAALSLAE